MTDERVREGEPMVRYRSGTLYGELWQQTHYGTMTVDSAREQIIAFFESEWFRERAGRWFATEPVEPEQTT
jgi:hypothetical protein